MCKEEIISQVETLAQDQEKYNKFKEYVLDFCNVPRCKKGVLEFALDLYNSKNGEGWGEFAIQLLTDKSIKNSDALRGFVFDHPITEGSVKALKDQRQVIMVGIAKYIMSVHDAIQESDCEDKAACHVALRNAIARFRGLLGGNRVTVNLDTVDWSKVEIPEWIKPQDCTLEELINPICDKKVIQEWADTWGDAQGLDQINMLLSLRTYLNHLDTVLEGQPA